MLTFLGILFVLISKAQAQTENYPVDPASIEKPGVLLKEKS